MELFQQSHLHWIVFAFVCELEMVTIFLLVHQESSGAVGRTVLFAPSDSEQREIVIVVRKCLV